MDENLTIDFRDPKIVKKAGLAALIKELGVTGTAYFIRQFDRGEGNYTFERGKIFDDLSHEEILNGIREIENKRR